MNLPDAEVEQGIDEGRNAYSAARAITFVTCRCGIANTYAGCGDPFCSRSTDNAIMT